MRLGEKHRSEQKMRVKDVLTNTSPEDVSLNEQIGLTPTLEEHMRTFLEFEADDYNQLVKQAETAIHLITLFPQEEQEFRTRMPIGKLIAKLQGTPPPHGATYGWSMVSFLAPEQVPALPEEIWDKYMEIIEAAPTNELKLQRAFEASRLFPDRVWEIKQKIKVSLEQFNPAEHAPDDILNIANSVLSLDPSLHARFHTYVVTGKYWFNKSIQGITRLGRSANPSSIARWFAAYKLLLAEHIKIGTNGILLAATEKPHLTKKQPLPDRELA